MRQASCLAGVVNLPEGPDADWPDPVPSRDGPRGDAPGARLVGLPGSEPLDVVQQEGLVAGVLGQPWWEEPALENLRKDRGFAASLLAAWREYGEALLAYVRGGFCLVVLEPVRRRALLAVDRFCVHPLAWHQVPSSPGLVFSSSVAAVRRHPAVKTRLSPRAIHDYLYHHMVPAPVSVFEGVHKLRAAERLLLDGERVSVARYWEPDWHERQDAAAGELRERLRESIAQAVERDIAPAGVTGCFLSGGLDSSTVAGMLARASGDGPRAYTMGFDAAGFDEMAYAQEAAQCFGLDLRTRYVQPDEVADAMPAVAAWYDEPFGNSSAVPAFICARTAAAEGTTRLLAGDGGDELFGGNERYVRQKIFGFYDRSPPWLQQLAQSALLIDRDGGSPLRQVPGVSKLVSYVTQARPGMPARYDTYNFLSRYGVENVLCPDVLAMTEPDHPMQLVREVWDRAPTEDMLRRMLYLDWQFTLADNDLRKVSGMCAAAGVEVRYPLLDEAVVDLSLRVPPHALVKSLHLRHFYKKAMVGFLPSSIINKRKHGFGLPFGFWLNESTRLRDVVYPTLASARQRGLVQPDFIDAMITAHRDQHAHYFGGMLWVIVMLELWLRAQWD